MNDNSSQETAPVHPQDRYYMPFNWIANGLINIVEYSTYLAYSGLGLVNLIALIPFGTYSLLNYLMYPSLTEEQLKIAEEKENDPVIQLLNLFGTVLKDYHAEPVIELIKSSRQSQFKNFLTILTNITTQEGFWSSPYLISWGIVQAILAIPFLALSLIMDLYNQLVLPAVILSSFTIGAVIYQLNNLWAQIICAPITIFEKLFENKNNQQEPPITYTNNNEIQESEQDEQNIAKQISDEMNLFNAENLAQNATETNLTLSSNNQVCYPANAKFTRTPLSPNEQLLTMEHLDAHESTTMALYTNGTGEEQLKVGAKLNIQDNDQQMIGSLSIVAACKGIFFSINMNTGVKKANISSNDNQLTFDNTNSPYLTYLPTA